MAELHSWLIVAAIFGLACILLFRIVHGGSTLIDAQRKSLNEKIEMVTALNQQNAHLHEKVRLAASRATTFNENILRRVSADLHNGPAQDLGLALMKVQTLCHTCNGCPGRQQMEQANAEESPTVRLLLQNALAELRTISTGLQLPNLESLSTNHLILRAVQDHQLKLNTGVRVDLPGDDRDASLPVKIALYRILQESLCNAYRHAEGKDQKVHVRYDESCVHIGITDGGNGFDIHAVPEHGHLGIKGMRERAEVLGGDFELHSSRGGGTTIRVSLPLIVPGDDHG